MLPWWLLSALKSRWFWIGLGVLAVSAFVYVKVVPWFGTRYLRQQQAANTEFLGKVETARAEIDAKDRAIRALSAQIQALTKRADAAHAQYLVIARDRDRLRGQTESLAVKITTLERERLELRKVESLGEAQRVLKKAGW